MQNLYVLSNPLLSQNCKIVYFEIQLRFKTTLLNEQCPFTVVFYQREVFLETILLFIYTEKNSYL